MMLRGLPELVVGLKKTELQLHFGRDFASAGTLEAFLERVKPEDRPAVEAFSRQVDLDLQLFTAESGEQVKQLIAEGANPKRVFNKDHSRPIDHMNAIDLQAIGGNKETVAALLEAGSPLSYRRLNGTGMPLKRALDRGNLDAAEAFIEADKFKADHGDICSAIVYGLRADPERGMAIVDSLISKASKESLNDQGYDPDDHSYTQVINGSVLAAAIAVDRADVLEKLLKAGAEPNSMAVVDALTDNCDAKSMPLMLDTLTAHGFDPAKAKSGFGDDLIIAAIAKGNAPLVSALKEKGISIDLDRLNQTEFGKYDHGRHFNLLERALGRRDIAAVTLLCENGASLEAATGNSKGSFTDIIKSPDAKLRNAVIDGAVYEFLDRSSTSTHKYYNQFDDTGKTPYEILLNVHARNTHLLIGMGVQDRIHISFKDLKAAVAKEKKGLDLSAPENSSDWAERVQDEPISARTHS